MLATSDVGRPGVAPEKNSMLDEGPILLDHRTRDAGAEHGTLPSWTQKKCETNTPVIEVLRTLRFVDHSPAF